MAPLRVSGYEIKPYADLSEAHLREADLSEANLLGADLGGACLIGADLREADLRWADLGGACLRGAHLREADLSEANLLGADLVGADLIGADLREANLRLSCLREADLREADLREADLRGAEVRGADLRGARLPAPSSMLLARWGVVPDGLTRRLMAHDARNHPDPAAFDAWAESETERECPYDDCVVGRAANFQEQRHLWTSELADRPVESAYELMCALLEERCTWERPPRGSSRPDPT